MTTSVDTLFQQGYEQYQAGASPSELLPTFKEVCDRDPKNAPAWACLAWLYLLDDKPSLALKAAQKSVKLEPRAPQSRVNLALALLESNSKGVREHVEFVQQMMGLDKELRSDILDNIEDGLARKPDWKSLQRVKTWLLED
jgi:cytochrome c-type biogenesis protein CcmH/NrfG